MRYQYATGRLEDSGRQNDEKMSRKIANAQSRATFFRHSAVLSLPALLLRKVSIYNRDFKQFATANANTAAGSKFSPN